MSFKAHGGEGGMHWGTITIQPQLQAETAIKENLWFNQVFIFKSTETQLLLLLTFHHLQTEESNAVKQGNICRKSHLLIFTHCYIHECYLGI